MSPREVIARAIFHADYDEDESWDGCPDLHPVYIKMADAVIDALEKAEVTEAMEDAWRRHDWTALPCPKGVESPWRAMVGAMRE